MENEKKCQYENCNQPFYGRGFCRKHYDYMRHKGLLEKLPKKQKQKCSVCGDDYLVKKYEDNYYCNKHYSQMKNHGKILVRTKYDPNEIVIHKDCAEVCLYNTHGQEIAKTKIDLDDIELIKKYKWGLNFRGYVETVVDKQHILLHRLIMNFPEDKVIDHINFNTLDNRKENLRICDHADNIRHSRLNRKNKYGIKGIGERNDINKKWYAKITINKKVHHLGYFYTFEEAVKARLDAENKYFGEYKPENKLKNTGDNI